MGKNGYLAQREADRRGYFRAGLETGRQQIIDMMCLVLHDPEYMGKDTFGKDRLLKVVKGLSDKLDLFDPAFQTTDETDYYQVQMDKLLAECFGVPELTDTFHTRYEYCLTYNYKTGKWK
jgi:hypothetical protein